MPRHAKPARLYLQRERRDAGGRLVERAVYVIRDGRHKRSTRCGPDQRREAEEALARYIAENRRPAGQRNRHPYQIPVADVLNLYSADIAPGHARPGETADRIKRLLAFFGDKRLSDINGGLCRAYEARRGSTASARRELEELRAAINYHREEGMCAEIVAVTLPEKAEPRERWLTRSEAAELIRQAWRYREVQKGVATSRRSRRHVSRFILVALYTGTRAGAICAAAFKPTVGASHIDLERGVFHRRPAGERQTKKRKPPVRLPARLLGHLRRWQRAGQRYAVEWNGEPVGSLRKAFARAADDAGLEDVTPHVLRHTAATWLMQAGVSIWEAAGFLGMSPETLWRVYGHHHPDYQREAAGAFSRPRSAPTVSGQKQRNGT